MRKVQDKVKVFCEQNKLNLSLEHRVLDTISELGEFSKEILKASNYGKETIVLNDKLKYLDAKFVANIHDEWQLQVKESQADFVGEMAVKSIIEAGEHFNLRCPMDGEYKVGGNWSDTH